MYDALAAEDPDRIRLYLAHHEGDLVAATIGDPGRAAHAWYSYGASSTEKREVRGSNAVQWAMIRDALAAGADVYDLRGITDTLEADDPHVGLIQFKVGTGGEAVEYVGEWDLPLNRPALRGFDLLHAAARDAASEEDAMSLTLTSTATAGAPTWARSPRATPGWCRSAKGNGYGLERPARPPGAVADARPRGRAASTPSRSAPTPS